MIPPWTAFWIGSARLGTTPQSSYGANWNYSLGQNGTSSGATPQTDMYGRQGTTPTGATGTPAAAPAKPSSGYGGYVAPSGQYSGSTGYTQQPQDSASGNYGSRGYGQHIL